MSLLGCHLFVVVVIYVCITRHHPILLMIMAMIIDILVIDIFVY